MIESGFLTILALIALTLVWLAVIWPYEEKAPKPASPRKKQTDLHMD
jgi:hypothetical protein